MLTNDPHTFSRADYGIGISACGACYHANHEEFLTEPKRSFYGKVTEGQRV